MDDLRRTAVIDRPDVAAPPAVVAGAPPETGAARARRAPRFPRWEGPVLGAILALSAFLNFFRPALSVMTSPSRMSPCLGAAVVGFCATSTWAEAPANRTS